jgi:predicted metal-dependent peptidase
MILNLKIAEDKENKLPKYGGMGVNARGDLFYKKEFVDKLSDPELKFCMAHETGHVMLNHLTRLGTRRPIKFNFACDIVLNSILRKNKFQAPEGLLMPDNNETFKQGNIKIEEIDKKTAEQIYDQIPDEPGDNGSGEGGYSGQFDYHDYEQLSEQEKEQIEQHWRDQVIDSATYAKIRGNMPAGLDRYIKEILHPTINWRQQLYKYIVSQIPFDYSWKMQSKKSHSLGVYLPTVLKECIKIVASIDTSGSIGEEEMHEFIGELKGIACSFNNVSITLIVCDCAIHNIVQIDSNHNEELESIKLQGRGGTSHFPVVNYINEEISDAKVLVSLTDGYSDIQDCFKELPETCDKLIVLSKNSVEPETLEEFGNVVKIE